MGSASRRDRHNPKRLGRKLKQIRLALGLSQGGILEELGNPEKLQQSSISGYERGARVPPALILLKYAKIAGVYVDVLLDDTLDLPRRLPAWPTSSGISRKGALSVQDR